MATEGSTDVSKDLDSNPRPIFPFEIIERILRRLPAKSLWQFRLVCKKWYSLITTSHFAETHLSMSTNKSDEFDFDRYRLISVQRCSDVVDCSLESVVINDPNFKFLVLDYPMKDPDTERSVSIVGSCNGLVCLVVEKSFILWNPITGKYKILPDSGFDSEVDFYGFGYDACSEDYKLVVIRNAHMDAFFQSLFWSRVRGMVYRWKTDCWVAFEGFSCSAMFGNSVESLNGFIYWTAYWLTKHKYLISFELESEEFGYVTLPKAMDIPNCGWDMNLGVLKGCLCVVLSTYEIKSDIWLLKKDGMTESWTKLVVIPHPSDLGFSPKPLCILKDGKILFGDQLEKFCFAMFDPQCHTFDYRVCKTSSVNGMRTYVGSLISPNADKEDERQAIRAV